MAPTVAIKIPAIAGPTILETLNCVELSASPAGICSWLTIDGTIEENDGIESASVIPTTSESAMISHGWAIPLNSNATMTIGHNIWKRLKTRYDAAPVGAGWPAHHPAV